MPTSIKDQVRARLSSTAALARKYERATSHMNPRDCWPARATAAITPGLMTRPDSTGLFASDEPGDMSGGTKRRVGSPGIPQNGDNTVTRASKRAKRGVPDDDEVVDKNDKLHFLFYINGERKDVLEYLGSPEFRQHVVSLLLVFINLWLHKLTCILPLLGRRPR